MDGGCLFIVCGCMGGSQITTTKEYPSHGLWGGGKAFAISSESRQDNLTMEGEIGLQWVEGNDCVCHWKTALQFTINSTVCGNNRGAQFDQFKTTSAQ